MKPSSLPLLFVSAAAWALASGASAQTVDVDYGKAEYTASCAGCHGPTGKGDGHFKQFLTRAPSDLTRLTKTNGGAFPAQRVYDVIDGAKLVPGHGTREMPIWGATYRAQAIAQSPGMSSNAQAYARTQINLLVDYVYRLQEK